jgi:hypothetical protein
MQEDDLMWVTGFNFLSHGSQDLHPTYLKDSKGVTTHDATVAAIIGNYVRRFYYLDLYGV